MSNQTRIQELIDQRVTLVKNSQTFLDECEADHGGMSEDESARFDAMHEDISKLKAQIDDLESEDRRLAEARTRADAAAEELDRIQSNAEGLQRLRNQGGNTAPLNVPQLQEPQIDRADAVNRVLKGWAQQGVQIENSESQAWKASGCRWDKADGGIVINLQNQAPHTLQEIVAAQSVGTDTAGGHTVPQGFVPSLEAALLAFGGVRSVASILRTATGNDLDLPDYNDTSNTGALLAENNPDSEQDVTFGNLLLNAYKYTSKIVKVSKEVMQDSAFNLGTELGQILGERLARIQNTHATTGTGSSQPNGIVTAASSGKTAASATAITTDELIDLYHSIDPAYRNGAGWMMHDNVALAIRKLKDGDSQYMWQPGIVAGQPDRLLGGSVTINQDMASSVATGNKTVLFGALSKYIVREVLDITVVRLVERYADAHQVGFVAIMRFDGDLRNAGTNPVKYLEQA